MNRTPNPSRLLILAVAIVLALLLFGLPGCTLGAPGAAGAVSTRTPVSAAPSRRPTGTPGPSVLPAPPAASPVASLAGALPAGTAPPVAPRAGSPPGSASPPLATVTMRPSAMPATVTPSPLGAVVSPAPVSPTASAPAAAPTRAPALPVPAIPAPAQTAPAPTGTPPAATPTALPVETPDPAAWLHRGTAHYDLYYLPGSPAARDIDTLATMAEDAMTWAARVLQAPPDARIRIYFVNRIFWQGGASYSHNELLLSYLGPDRDYTSTSLTLVLRHETTHALVEQLLGSPAHKGGLLGEGVAVWDAGGHYQTEQLNVLASTLVADNAGLYIPLSTLQRDFYDAQHEIAYLEGGAYVQFLVSRYGLPTFKRYLDQPANPLPIYGLDSGALEAAWRAWLAATPHTAADGEAVRLRVRYYDLMRRYETRLDPNARLLPGTPPSAWGPVLIGLFSRPAASPLDATLEQDFVRAGKALWSRDLATCTQILNSIDSRIP